jgi:glycosyltransferase involved in cell wall biosynthesis
MSRGFGVSERAALDSYLAEDFEIITIGEHLSARLAEMGRECSVVDVGFYRELYRVDSRGNDIRPRVLMYGADGHKGPDQAAIAAAIRGKVPGAVINSFHRYGPLPEWSDEHFRPDTTAEVARIYAYHDVYVYASETDGFAMTPIEAMACGTPVVLTDFPGKDQYASNGENCLIAPFRDVGGVADRTARILRDSRLNAWVVTNGFATADRYDWSRVGAQYARVMLGAPI